MMFIRKKQPEHQPRSFRLWFGTRSKARYKERQASLRQEHRKDEQAITTKKTCHAYVYRRSRDGSAWQLVERGKHVVEVY
jgi:hypothetical protein